MKKTFTKLLIILLSLGAIVGVSYGIYSVSNIMTIQSKVSDIKLSIKWQTDTEEMSEANKIRYFGVIENFNFNEQDIEYFYWKIGNNDTGELITYSITSLYTSISGIDNSELGDNVDLISVLVLKYVAGNYDVELFMKLIDSDAICYSYVEVDLP